MTRRSALGRTRDRLRYDDAAEGAEAEEGDGVEGRLRATVPDRYWNDALKTLAPTERRRLEDDRLVEQIAYDVATSPFYRARLDGAGVRPDEIRHVEDLARIPFMDKADVAESQADGTLLGINQCAPLDAIVRIQATGGTTGRPMRIGLTRRDIADYGQMGAGALWAMGCRPGDIVFER